MNSGSYRIGEVASATGVSVDTLRFYEREKLLPKAGRSSGGARRYDDHVMTRVQFIKQAQAVGLTLRDIRVLLEVRERPTSAACRRTRAILAERIEELQQRLRELQAFQDILSAHLRSCDRALGQAHTEDCPTLDAIVHGASIGSAQ